MQIATLEFRPWIISILIKLHENDLIYTYPNTNLSMWNWFDLHIMDCYAVSQMFYCNER
jgi:hypothetical protein